MQGPFYTSPVFVVPVIWILFLSGILWASQPFSRQSDVGHDDGGH
jgi:hypothetical protein